MPKISNKEESEKAEMSYQMIKNCKDKIAKYGFGAKEYVQFLISVKAMKDETTVLKYGNHELDKYREEFIKENEHSIGDSFQLDKFKIKSSDHNGKQYETGYFAPRSFWDKVLESKSKII